MTKKELVKKNILEEQRHLRKKKEVLILWEDLIANINDAVEKCTEEELETAKWISFHYQLLDDGRWARAHFALLCQPVKSREVRLTNGAEIFEVESLDSVRSFLNQVRRNTKFDVTDGKMGLGGFEIQNITYFL